ncbi:FtsX-like permease family protein [Gudongella sp. DL1XJH-153]|uniref:FtsX-like permease family protein n=1 Tax=Gudongella sp. DL1XJH-153 TaxID=3409804 RepID=UPI003BB51D1A
MVVKNAYGKIVSREFVQSFGRFAAIFGIVALGVGFLSGLLVTTPDMHNSVDEYYDRNNMADIFIKGTMGITENDLHTVSQLEEVNEVMPAYVMDMIVDTSQNGTLVTRIYGLPLIKGEANINRLELLEGRMPEKADEVLVERSGSYLSDIPLGSTITISPENEDYEDIGDYFHVLTYKVVGVVGNTFHFSTEREVTNVGSGKLGSIIYSDESSYALDNWTDLYITAKGAISMDAFSNEYGVKIKRILDKLESISEERSAARYEEILDEAESELADGWEEYNDGKSEADQELADAWKDILEGRVELSDALKELQDGEKELSDARVTLRDEVADAEKEIADGEQELADAFIELKDAEKELADVYVELQDGEKEYYEGYLEFLDGKREYEDGLKEYQDGEDEYQKGIGKIEDGKRELAKGERELERGRRELEAGEDEYSDGVEELQEGKDQLLAGVSQIADKFGIQGFTPQELVGTASGQAVLRGTIDGARTQLEEGVEQVENGISLLEDNLENARAGRSQLELQLQALEEDPDSNQESIEAIELEIQTLDSQITVMEQELEPLEQELQALEAQLGQLPNPEELIGGWNQILSGERELEYARRQLDDGWDEYYDGRSQLRDAQEEIEEGEEELQEAREELDDAKQEIQDAEKEIREGELELQDGRRELDDGWKEYNDGLVEVEDGWKEYQDGLVEIEDAKVTLREEVADAEREIADAEIEIRDGWKEYKDGVIELEDGEREYFEEKNKAEEELADAYAELMDAERVIAELEMPEWYVLDRESNMSFVNFQLNAEKVAAIAKFFPIFFYLVAALVSLTTMTRMVEEERTQIGILKALGFRKISIIGKYVAYCGLASILGSAAGQLVGFKLIPRVIWNAYGVMFHLPPFISEYNAKIALIASGIAVLSTVAVTVYAANDALREKAATLMLPRAPKAGKRILLERFGPLWRKMSFNMKSTARNIFRYKKHFYMTVVGISGCTALLMIGFGMRNSIRDFAGAQFDDIFRYQISVELDEEEFADRSLDQLIDNLENVESYAGIYSDKGIIRYDNDLLDLNAMVFHDSQQLSEFILTKDREAGEIIVPGTEYVIITEKLSEVLGISIGDTIVYEDADENRGELKVTHITENYLRNYMYVDSAKYESVFGASPVNSALLRTKDMTDEEEDSLVERLLLEESVLNVELVSQTRTSFDNLIRSIDYIVFVIIVASGLLAFIVLYNLTNININERKKELATLKVLGFHNEEVSSHIFREIAILTIIGIIVGLFLGRYMHEFIIKTIEDPDFMFGRDIRFMSYVFSAVITVVFSFIVNVFMSKKIRNIEMVESMKAND